MKCEYYKNHRYGYNTSCTNCDGYNMNCERYKAQINIKNKEQEAIDHPNHYKKSGISESIEIIIALGYGVGFCIGNALKYLYRAGIKDKSKYLEDLKKAKWYLDKAIELIEKEKN